MIGGMPETQEMLDYCGRNNIAADVEVIPIQKINEAFERMLKQDVKYRFVIDMSSLDNPQPRRHRYRTKAARKRMIALMKTTAILTDMHFVIPVDRLLPWSGAAHRAALRSNIGLSLLAKLQCAS